MGVLHIFLFGSMRINHNNLACPVKTPRMTQALLAYLLLQRQRSQPREVIADVFWGEQSPESSHSCLNTALWRLRQVLEPDGVVRGTYLLTPPTGDVGFNWDSDHWLDVEIFQEHARITQTTPLQAMREEDAQRLAKGLQLYTGELLKGFYDDWVLREREHWRCLYLNGLAHLMHYFAQRQQFEQSLTYGQQILDEDPLREEIHQAMIRLYLQNKQRTLAVRQYEICRKLLTTELGIAPMDETQALYAQILQDSTPTQTALVPPQGTNSYHDAVQQLQAALQHFDEAQQLLRRAVKLVEQLVVRA